MQTVMENEKKTLDSELKKIEAEDTKLTNTLSISITMDGQMSWVIPKDMLTAIFLHKHLDVILSKMIDSKLQRAFEMTPKIIKPDMGVIK